MTRLNEIENKLRQLKIVPVIAVDKAEDILPLADALATNGLPVAEITFRSPAAFDAINLLREHNPEILIAAGTVLTKDQLKLAHKANVDFIVTPGFNPNIVKMAQDLDLVITPGVNSPSTIETALELEIETVKFFPAEASGGIKMIKALLGPYSMLKIIPTGGISPSNINDYLAIKNVLACGGSWMCDKTLVNNKNFAEIARLTKEAVNLVK